MMSLFESFDFFIFGSKFFIPLLFVLFFFFSFSVSFGFLGSVMKDFVLVSSQMVYVVKSKKIPKFISLFFYSIFLLIFFFNFSSIFPYTFSYTTQMSIVLFFSICIWFSFLYFSFLNNWKNFVSHKIPEGSPMPLSIFLFLIELVSELIRPLTLTLRLVGNMVVGHVLLMLLYKLMCYMNFVFPLFLILNMIEVLVSLIQSYIYFTLVSMYFSEI